MTDSTKALPDALAEVLRLFEAAKFGKLSVSSAGFVLENKHMFGDGVYGNAAPALVAAVNFIRQHGSEIQAMADDARRLRTAIQVHKDQFPDEPLDGELALWSATDTLTKGPNP